MDGRVVAAAADNAHWCDLVCRSHGVPTEVDERLWVALRRSPEFYPDAVTRAPGLAAELVLARVDDGPGCSVKDSFADLDLGSHGFRELFRAQWFFREPGTPAATRRCWTTVQTAEDVAAWARAADLEGVIRPELLHDADVRILAANGSGGAIVCRTGDVAGVSNVFGTGVWADLPAAVAALYPSLALVGYERDDALDEALGAGFTAIGPLKVWMR